MSKAKEISALWSEIRPQIGKMINLCHQIESHAELHDNVTADAFQKGYDAAWEDIQPKIDAAYQKGMNDLWEAMQKAIKMYCEIDNEVFLRVFHDVKCDWGESLLQALFKNTPRHLIDSIRKYEQKKEKKDSVWIASETWIVSEANEPSVDTTLICSKCGYAIKIKPHETPALNFCPKCGDCKKPKEEKS